MEKRGVKEFSRSRIAGGCAVMGLACVKTAGALLLSSFVVRNP